MELNKVLLVGRLTRDPEFRTTTTGRPVANMRLAVNRKRNFDRETGESQDETVFVDVTVWERSAEFAHNYLTKGRLIFVEGRLRQENWQDRETGQNRTKISVVAERIQFAEPRPDGAGGQGQHGGAGDEEHEANSRPGSWAAPAQPPPSPSPAAPARPQPTEDDLPF